MFAIVKLRNEIVGVVVFAAACSGSHSHTHPEPIKDPVPMVEPGARSKAELLADETAAYEKAKPVFDKWCAKCHSKDGKMAGAKKLDHFDMTTYPFGGHHAMEIAREIRKSLGIGGGTPRMPADDKGAVQGEELARIEAWADAFDASHVAGAHEGHGGHQH